MADNVAVTAGSGTDVATDERTIDTNTVHVQRVAPHGNPAITVGQTTVTNSNTQIVAVNDNRSTVTLVNRQTVAVWIDDGTAATSTGFRLDPGDSITLDTSAVINGITSAAYTASGDAKVHYIESHD
jgi:hypothetical protein